MKRRSLLHMRTRGISGPAFAKHHQVPGLSKSVGNSAGESEPPDPPQFDGLSTWPATFEMFEEALFTFNAKPYWAAGGFISSWSLEGPAVPPWLTISSSGVISGTPPPGSAGTFSLTVVGDNVTGPPAPSTSITVTISLNVAITFNPQAQFGEIGSEVSFVCQATAATGYQWYRNGVAIPGATGFVYKTPPIAQGDNANEYFCKVEGQGGVLKDTQPARLTTMQKYNNLADGSGVASLVVALTTGTYTLSMSGSGLTKLYEVTASVIGIG